MKNIVKLAKSVCLVAFSYLATMCAIVPFMTIGYTPSFSVALASVIVFLGMARVGMVQRRNVKRIWAEMRSARSFATGVAC